MVRNPLMKSQESIRLRDRSTDTRDAENWKDLAAVVSFPSVPYTESIWFALSERYSSWGRFARSLTDAREANSFRSRVNVLMVYGSGDGVEGSWFAHADRERIDENCPERVDT